MRYKLNEAQTLLKIESTLLDLFNNQIELDNYNLTQMYLDFNELYNLDNDYIGCLNAFVCLSYDLKYLHHDFETIYNEFEDIGFDNVVNYLKKYSFYEDYLNIRKQKRKNQESLKRYCNSIIEEHSRILVIRVDLGYLQDRQNWLNITDFYNHFDILLQRIHNKDGVFKHLVGYAWGIEQGGQSKGYHCHLAVIYNNAYRSSKTWYWGNEIIELWKEITNFSGQGFNCYEKQRVCDLESRQKLGIGVISRNNQNQVNNFIDAMSYIARAEKNTEQYLRVKPNNCRTFGKGRYP